VLRARLSLCNWCTWCCPSDPGLLCELWGLVFFSLRQFRDRIPLCQWHGLVSGLWPSLPFSSTASFSLFDVVVERKRFCPASSPRSRQLMPAPHFLFLPPDSGSILTEEAIIASLAPRPHACARPYKLSERFLFDFTFPLCTSL